jgi:hypothetical protein
LPVSGSTDIPKNGSPLTARAVLGAHEASTARVDQAITAYRAALDVFAAAGAEYYEKVCRENLTRAQALLEERRK